MNHLLVTNDFPPKIGGIQSYLHELWRRLPASEVTVVTTSFDGAEAFDAAQDFRVVRLPERFLAPTPALISAVDRIAHEVDAGLVLLDPVWPLGAIGPRLTHPYGVVVHGAELTVPARLPFVQLSVRAALRNARLVVAAGGYPAAEARKAAGRDVPTVVVPPGVDVERFSPLTPDERATTRAHWQIDPAARVVLCVSRLVPRKGVDVLIQAVARLADEVPGLELVVAGAGRDRARLEQLATAFSAPVRFLGMVADADLPALYGAADVFAMLCRDRWGGLEQEGFGIVFLEAAAAGVPSVAGASGGAAEAVAHGETGLVVDTPQAVDEVEAALAHLLDPATTRRLGRAARERAEREFAYDHLAPKLHAAIVEAAEAAEIAEIAEAAEAVEAVEAVEVPNVTAEPPSSVGAPVGADPQEAAP